MEIETTTTAVSTDPALTHGASNEYYRLLRGTKYPNHPGYDHPLQYRRIKPSDARQLQKVIQESSEHLSGFLKWAEDARDWTKISARLFAAVHANDDWPREHFVFTINGEIVGMCSLAPTRHPAATQLSYWVAETHTRKGIGEAMALTLEHYVFRVMGYWWLEICHDVNNIASGRIPEKLGYTFVGTELGPNEARNESGVWDWPEFR